MKPWAWTLACVISALNLMCLIFWFSATRIEVVDPPKGVTTYDAISLQITILSIVVAAVAFGLAIVSVFGYQAIRAGLLEHAEKLVNEHLGKLKTTPGITDNRPTGTAIPPDGAEPVAEEETI